MERRAFCAHVKYARCPQTLVEGTIGKRDRHALGFGQCLGIDGVRADRETDRISLPYVPARSARQTVFGPREREREGADYQMSTL
jgi:hypothetical protein